MNPMAPVVRNSLKMNLGPVQMKEVTMVARTASVSVQHPRVQKIRSSINDLAPQKSPDPTRLCTVTSFRLIPIGFSVIHIVPRTREGNLFLAELFCGKTEFDNTHRMRQVTPMASVGRETFGTSPSQMPSMHILAEPQDAQCGQDLQK